MPVSRPEVKRRYLDGETTAEIAEDMGCTRATVQRILERYRHNGEIPGRLPIDKGKVMALWNAGWNVPDIASDMRRTEQEVVEVIRNVYSAVDGR